MKGIFCLYNLKNKKKFIQTSISMETIIEKMLNSLENNELKGFPELQADYSEYGKECFLAITCECDVKENYKSLEKYIREDPLVYNKPENYTQVKNQKFLELKNEAKPLNLKSSNLPKINENSVYIYGKFYDSWHSFYDSCCTRYGSLQARELLNKTYSYLQDVNNTLAVYALDEIRKGSIDISKL